MAVTQQHMEGVQREFVFTDRDFRQLASLVMAKTGIVLADHKKNMVYSRIARRLRALGLKTFKEYIELLEGQNSGDELADFMNAVTTNLTRFFRESHHFDHLQHQVLEPLAVSRPSQRRLRLWSAGCSSGMEAYSMAMSVCEAIPDLNQWDIKILATDIDTNMLDRGREGIYRKEDVSEVPAALCKKYLIRAGGPQSNQVQVVDKLKQLVYFKKMNFMEKWPVKGPFDVVFCRNVVIYFNKETQRKLFASFASVMAPEAWLYIGHSENINSISDQFILQGKTVHRKVAS